MKTFRADLHVHSSHSNKPSYWALRKFNCPESYSSPEFIYHAARRQGMDYVTITDHNTINGALDIAHLPGAFVSIEVTAYFPEDGCKVHMVALHITEETFREINRLRKNIFAGEARSLFLGELCSYRRHEVSLRGEGLP